MRINTWVSIIVFQDYQVDLYLRQRWFDPRLNHPQLLDPLDLNDPNLVKAIWKPEVYFPNAKDAEFQYVTVWTDAGSCKRNHSFQKVIMCTICSFFEVQIRNVLYVAFLSTSFRCQTSSSGLIPVDRYSTCSGKYLGKYPHKTQLPKLVKSLVLFTTRGQFQLLLLMNTEQCFISIIIITRELSEQWAVGKASLNW